METRGSYNRPDDDTAALLDLNMLQLPAPHHLLAKRTPEYFKKQLKDLTERLKDFQYLDLENSNDIREGYLQFMDDADKFLKYFEEIIVDICEAMRYYDSMREYYKGVSRITRQLNIYNETYHSALQKEGIDALNPMSTVNKIQEEINDRVRELQRRKQKLDEAEQDIAITADLLAKKKSEMELALQSRYTLTQLQKQVLLEEKDMILDGVEQWGSITGALSHNPKIKSNVQTIYSYCTMFPEFGKAIEISKALFKDRLQGIMVERAIEGTENPVFGKGEYIGDYKIKDNKLLVELMKAKVPEEYNKKSTDSGKGVQVDNINIISFANLDETKEGFTRDVGVVIDVDETGKVKRVQQETQKSLDEIRRVQQEEKMLEYYKNKPGAEIIEPEDKEDEDGL